MSGPSAQAGDQVFEKSAGWLGFHQGIAALIWGLDVFPWGVSCCHYTRRFLNEFDFLVYVIDLILVRVALDTAADGKQPTKAADVA